MPSSRSRWTRSLVSMKSVMTTKSLVTWIVLLLAACSSATGPDSSGSGEVATVLITPATSSVALGAQLPLQASVQDASGRPLSTVPIVWTVKDPTIASVSASGVVTALALGTTQVSANANGRFAIATITVQRTSVASVVLRPDRATVTPGEQLQLSAQSFDASQAALADRPIIWSSSNVGVATVDANGMLTGVAAGTATITATIEGKNATAVITVNEGSAASVSITPSPLSMNVGQSVQAVAIVRDANGTVITGGAVVWSSSDNSAATVTQGGVITGTGPGTATITATSQGRSGAATVSVSSLALASVAVLPGATTITPGGSVQLATVLTDVEGSTVTGRQISWSSSNPAVATVSPSGLVTGVAPGATVITAASGGKSGTAAVTVTQTAVGSVSVAPATSTLTVGTTKLLVANVSDANGAPLTGRVVVWSSSDAAVATVSQAGVVTAVAPGTATISATSEGRSGTATIVVGAVPVATIGVSPQSAALTIGQSAAFAAITKDAAGNTLADRTIAWTSSNTSVASVSSSGTVTALAAGSATITVTSEGQSATAAVTVSAPTPVTVPVGAVTLSTSSAVLTTGQSTSLTVTVTNANGAIVTDRVVSWTSSNAAVATVTPAGVISAVAPGTAIIIATSEGKSSAPLTITVNSPPAPIPVPAPVASVVVSPAATSLVQGQGSALSVTLRDDAGNTLTDRTVTWTSSNPAVVSVSSSGVIIGVAPGSATITAASGGQSGTASVTVSAPPPAPVASVTVTPASLSLVPGQSSTLGAVTRDAVGNVLTGRAVSWSSSNSAIATVSQSGVVTAVAPGSATITATSETRSGSAAVTVAVVPVANVAVTPASSTVTPGATTQLAAATTDASGAILTGRTITWTSSNPAVATVSSSGLVTGVAAGTVTITATSEGKSGTATVTVSPPAVGSVTVAPASASVVQGQTTTLAATVKDVNGAVLTDRIVTWTSSNAAVATVSQTGVVAGVAPGSATITASTGGQSGTAAITVTAPAPPPPPAPAPVASVSVAPTTLTLVQGQTGTLTATTRDGSGAALTGRTVTWTSSNAAVATVNAATGVVTAVAPGTATITATSETKAGTSAVTVTAPPPAPVNTVTVTPPSATLTAGQAATVSLTATTKDINGNTLTGRTVTWASSNTAIATVSSSGVVTAGTTAGTAIITATSEGKSGTATITVNAGASAKVATVQVTPSSGTLSPNSTIQLTVIVKDANGNVITDRPVTWTSSNTQLGTVSATGRVTGPPNGTKKGTVTITATVEGVSGTAVFSVP